MECKFCGKKAIKQFKNGNWCCEEVPQRCLEVRKKWGEKNKISLKGRIPWNKGKKLSADHIRKTRQTGKIPWNKNQKWGTAVIEKIKESQIKNWKDPESKYNQKEFREKVRVQWYSGHGKRIKSLIKRTSKEELKLREIIKELYPTFEHTYKILNYDVDVALPEYKIAIEFDGYYHFDTKEHKEYHKKRQQEIEQEGWKFLRYNIFQKFPTLEQVKKDTQRIIT